MAFGAFSVSSNEGGVATLTIPAPTGTVTGGVMVLAAWDEASPTITTPTGFTLIASNTTAAATRGGLWVWAKETTGSEPSSYSVSVAAGTFTWGNGVAAFFSGRTLTGVVTGTVLDKSTSSVSWVVPGVTAPASADLCLIGGSLDWATTFTGPGDLTEQADTEPWYIYTANAVSAGATGTKTLTGSAAADLGKAVLIALPAAAGSNSGTLAATLPKVTGSITGTSTDPGTLSTNLPKVTGVLTGSSTNSGTLVATLAVVVGSIAGTVVNPGAIAATLPRVTGGIAGTQTNSGTLSAQLPKVTGSISSQSSNNDGTLSATLSKVTGSLAGTSTDPGALAGVLPKVTGSTTGTQTNAGALSATLPKVVGAISDQATVLGTLAATLPKVTAALVGSSINPAMTSGALPKVTGSIVGTSRNPGVTAATLPAVVGSLVGVMTNSGTLVGILPKVTGSVLDFIIPPLPIDGVSITIDAGTRGLSVTTEARDMEVTA